MGRMGRAWIRAARWGLVLAPLLAGCRSPSSADPPPESASRPAAPAGHEAPAAAAAEALAEAPDAASPRPAHRARDVAITVLSTTQAKIGAGEWGFSALVDVEGTRILFDTGAGPKTVLHNAEAAGVDLSTVSMVVLSHHHGDHVGGLLTLRRAVQERAPEALATVHVARGAFQPRRLGPKERQINALLRMRPAFEETGGRFVEHDRPTSIAPGVWVTGPVPRVHPERNWSGSRRVAQGDRWVEDTLPESQALVIDTAEGLVVLSGCGHAGIVNTLEHARATIRSTPVRAAVGGFHLHRASSEHLAWTAEHLRRLELGSFYGAHCTGARAVRRFGDEAASEGGEAEEVAVGWTLRLGPSESARR